MKAPTPKAFIWIVVLMVFFGVIEDVNSNDTFVYDNGYAAYPIKTDKIRMAAEKIYVVMSGAGTSREAKVVCEFVFENTTNTEVRATIGFPAEDRYYYDVPDGAKPEPPLRDFVSFVNSTESQVSIREQEEKTGWRGIYWYTWDVMFPPAQKITLKNEYKAPLSSSYYNQWFTYILTTGANWKGPIGHSIIEVAYDSSSDLKGRVRSATPKQFKIHGNIIRWEFKDFVPSENIQVYENNIDSEGNLTDVTGRLNEGLVETFRATRYDGDARFYVEKDLDIRNKQGLMRVLQDLKKEYVGNVKSEEQFMDDVNVTYLRLLRNQIYAKRGRYFRSEYLRNFFMRVGGYNSGPEYSDALLNAFERKNIDYIAAYEAKLVKK